MAKVLAAFTNENAMTAEVFESLLVKGTYGVALKDEDSGEYLNESFHGYATFDAAIAKAQAII